ncbi:MAG: lamin tail domain-containing protein [Pleomorphochaeta sp.]
MKKIKYLFVSIICMIILFGCELSTGFDLGYSFYITEVSTSGSVGGLSVDYVELYNNTDEDIDLTGYYFGDSEGYSNCYEVKSTLSLNEWDSTNLEWVSTTTTDSSVIIKANDYLLILYSNDFKIVDEISMTELVTWEDDGETQTVDDEFSNIEYLTIPEGLKGSKAEGVYIYDSEGNEVTNTFTYEADEQEDDQVFLYIDGEWEQGEASPGEANE